MTGSVLRGALFGFVLAAVATTGVRAQSASPPPVATEPFDFYVMTLSWSPGFCDTGGDAKSPEQCAVGSGEGFVVHGLWPDNSRSEDPAYCDQSAPISDAALALTRGVYPSEGLAAYEYRKHGTCTGLSAEDYFTSVRYLRDQLVIPDMLKAPHERLKSSPQDIQQAFIAANANLRADNMAITCRDGELEEVRFCVSRDLKAFALCPKVSGHTCHSSSIAVAPLR
jgi:ribonuclease T2